MDKAKWMVALVSGMAVGAGTGIAVDYSQAADIEGYEVPQVEQLATPQEQAVVDSLFALAPKFKVIRRLFVNCEQKIAGQADVCTLHYVGMLKDKPEGVSVYTVREKAVVAVEPVDLPR